MHYPWWHVPFLTAPMLNATSRQVVQNAEARRLLEVTAAARQPLVTGR